MFHTCRPSKLSDDETGFPQPHGPELLGRSEVRTTMIQPRLFMTIRCENAQTRRETGKRSREGGRRILCSTLTD